MSLEEILYIWNFVELNICKIISSKVTKLLRNMLQREMFINQISVASCE